MALKEKSNQQQENKKAFRSCNTDSSSSANSQLKFQSRPADSYNLTDNSAIGKPSGEISYASNSASNVVTEETFHLMDDLNLQGLNDISVLWEAPVDDPTIAETGAIYTGKEVEISKSDSKKSEQLKLQGSIPDSEGDIEHWATELRLHCEAVHIIMICEGCSKTVDCQLCPICEGPISTIYLPS